MYYSFRHNNNNDVKITSKEHDNSSDEKEVNESILVLGDRLTESNYVCVAPDTNGLFSTSDQESTSGEEDVLGQLDSCSCATKNYNYTFSFSIQQMRRKLTNLIQIQY